MIYQLNYCLFSLSLRSRKNSIRSQKLPTHFYRGIQLHVRLKGTRIALLAAYYYIEGATLRLQFNVSETLDATFSFQLRRWRHTFHHCAIVRLPIPPHEQIWNSILFAHGRARTGKTYSNVITTQKGLEPSPPHPCWVALFRFELLRYLQRENYTAVRPLLPLGVTPECILWCLVFCQGRLISRPQHRSVERLLTSYGAYTTLSSSSVPGC